MAHMRSATLTLFAALTLGIVAGRAAADPTLVRIDAGEVRGAEADGVISFKGIPYAAPPVGDLRWRNPQPVKPWEGVLDADAFGPACMQTDDLPKSEDCLTLNVWRPAAESRALYPVMVWIYGGGAGAGQHRPLPGGGACRRRRGGGQHELPARPARVLRPPGAGRGIARRASRQLRLHGPARGAEVGEAQHRRLRRRPRPGDNLRRVGRRRLGDGAPHLAAVARPLRARDPRVARHSDARATN